MSATVGCTHEIARATSNNAPIILLYGAEGRGKTSLASKFENPLAFLLESGLPRGVSIDAAQVAPTFDALMEALRGLYADPLGYRTLIFDTVDALEALLIEGLCAKNHWKNIEQPSYGKGWVAADDEWRRFLRAVTAIRDKHDITVVLTCHATIERIDDPRAPTYTSYQPRLHKRARWLVMDACDAVFFLAEDLRVRRERFSRTYTRGDRCAPLPVHRRKPRLRSKKQVRNAGENSDPSRVRLRQPCPILGPTRRGMS